MDIWTIWYPILWLAGGIQLATALASVAASVLLIRLVPDALRLPSRSALKIAHLNSKRESDERLVTQDKWRTANVTLEARAVEGTAQSEALNRALRRDNARFALAANAAGLGFWSLDSTTSTFDWDDRMFRLYGRGGHRHVTRLLRNGWISCTQKTALGANMEIADLLSGGRTLEMEFA